MEQRKRIVIIGATGLFLVLSLLLSRNSLEYFFLHSLGYLSSDIESPLTEDYYREYYEEFKPFRNWEIEPLQVDAKGAFCGEIDKEGFSQKVLFEKDSEKSLPIASLTKLMTACVVMENYDLFQEITIKEEATLGEGDSGFFKAGETFYAKDLLYSMLMESSNAAAESLAEAAGKESFVNLMNEKARELKMRKTHFSNPTGLEPENPSVSINVSTARDISLLASYIYKNPPLWNISNTKEYNLYQANGFFHHKIENKNELLGQGNGEWWKENIIGGKTGWTPKAGECLVLAVENPKNDDLLVGVILGSGNRFGEMKNMINWIYQAYRW